MPTVKQGDSLWLDINLNNWKQINPIWEPTTTGTWGGSFEIATSETATPAFSGVLVCSDNEGVLELRVNSEDTSLTSPNPKWSEVTVGTYNLYIEINNTETAYKEEMKEKLIIKAQAI